MRFQCLLKYSWQVHSVTRDRWSVSAVSVLLFADSLRSVCWCVLSVCSQCVSVCCQSAVSVCCQSVVSAFADIVPMSVVCVRMTSVCNAAQTAIKHCCTGGTVSGCVKLYDWLFVTGVNAGNCGTVSLRIRPTLTLNRQQADIFLDTLRTVVSSLK